MVSKRTFRVTFTLGCFFLTSYMTNTQIMKWLENKDASAISFRRFNLSPEDLYPEISICFTGHEIHWFNDDLIFRLFGVTTEVYEDLLKGYQGFAYDYNHTSELFRKYPINKQNWITEDVEKFQLQVSNIVTGLEFATLDDLTNIGQPNGKKAKLGNGIPILPSYQTPDTICFTTQSNDAPNTLRAYDLLAFNRSVLGNGRYRNVVFQIFLHYPQQLLRSFHNPVFKSSFENMKDDKFKYWYLDYDNHGEGQENPWNPWEHILRVTISKVTVLRKRTGANVPCDGKLRNDDLRLQSEIMKHIQCIPIYWKNIVGSNLNLKICNSPEDLEKAYYHIQRYIRIFSTYKPPCVSIEISSKYDNKEENESKDPQIKFIYTDSHYAQIANTENYGFESFVSGVGGFVGIFLGYSILQLPELLSLLPTLFRKFREHCKKGKILVIIILARTSSNYSKDQVLNI